jgi:hypothetical protein
MSVVGAAEKRLQLQSPTRQLHVMFARDNMMVQRFSESVAPITGETRIQTCTRTPHLLRGFRPVDTRYFL